VEKLMLVGHDDVIALRFKCGAEGCDYVFRLQKRFTAVWYADRMGCPGCPPVTSGQRRRDIAAEMARRFGRAKEVLEALTDLVLEVKAPEMREGNGVPTLLLIGIEDIEAVRFNCPADGCDYVFRMPLGCDRVWEAACPKHPAMPKEDPATFIDACGGRFKAAKELMSKVGEFTLEVGARSDSSAARESMTASG